MKMSFGLGAFHKPGMIPERVRVIRERITRAERVFMVVIKLWSDCKTRGNISQRQGCK